MNTRVLLLATVALATMSFPALAQVPAEMEGRLNNLTINVAAGTGTLKVFNTTVKLNATTTFSTPTREGLTLAQINGCHRNRVYPGFLNRKPSMVGGTVIVTGTSDPVAGVTAESVFLEPDENVLLGRVTEVPVYTDVTDPATGTVTKVYQSGALKIDGTEVVLLPTKAAEATATVPWNQCTPGLGIKNDFGFAIDPWVMVVDDEAAAEGWFGDDGKFYAFLIETAAVGSAPEMSVSIQRAQCRDRNDGMEWEIRGGVASGSVDEPGDGIVEVGQRISSPTQANPDRMIFQAYPNAFTNAVSDPLNPMLGTYRFTADDVPGLSGAVEPCPSTVFVRYSNNGGPPFKAARSGVDVR